MFFQQIASGAVPAQHINGTAHSSCAPSVTVMILGTRSTTCALRIAFCVMALGVARHAAADTITLEWDPATEPVGYKVHVGVTPGTYTQHFDVGSATLFSYANATAGQRYCFTVTAYLLSSQLEGPASGEVCGYSNQPPTLANPGARSSTVGVAITGLQLQGSDPDSQPLTYGATGLPPGLSVQASTGYISGTGTTAGNYSVTARASDGSLTVSQTFTWTMTAPAGDTTRPTATITSPTTNTSYSTSTSSISLGGSAADNVGVVQVRWASDKGSTGTATGTTSWSATAIPLVPGSNVITITAVDAAGNQGTDSLTVTYTAPAPTDTTLPTISIASPTSGSSYSTTTSSLALSGSAADNVGVTQVRWANNKGGNGVAAGTANWSTTAIALVSGSNVITVTAVDAAGNQSTASLTVNYSVTTTQPPSTVTLNADPRKAAKWRSTRLSWANAPWTGVDVYRNNLKITTVPNNGLYTDPIFNKGTYTYQICAQGTTTCSNTTTVFF